MAVKLGLTITDEEYIILNQYAAEVKLPPTTLAAKLLSRELQSATKRCVISGLPLKRHYILDKESPEPRYYASLKALCADLPDVTPQKLDFERAWTDSYRAVHVWDTAGIARPIISKPESSTRNQPWCLTGCQPMPLYYIREEWVYLMVKGNGGYHSVEHFIPARDDLPLLLMSINIKLASKYEVVEG